MPDSLSLSLNKNTAKFLKFIFKNSVVNKDSIAQLDLDSISVYVNEYKKNGNIKKTRKKKLYVQGDFTRFLPADSSNSNSSKISSSVDVLSGHEVELNKYLKHYLSPSNYKGEYQWYDIQKIKCKETTQSRVAKDGSSYVYGFHPYWMGRAYKHYNFNLYDRIAYYGYVINPKSGRDLSMGVTFNAHSWGNTAIHEKSKKYNFKVDLCIASYGLEKNRMFFQNKEALDTLLINLKELLNKKGDGLCVDIQKVPLELKSNFIALISKLKDKVLKTGQELTMILPRYDIGFPYLMGKADFIELSKYVDRWILTGESYYRAEVNDADFSEEEIDQFWNYAEIDFEIDKYPADKLILEIPLYHSRFEVTSMGDTLVRIFQFRNFLNTNPNSSKVFTTSFRDKIIFSKLKNIKGVALWGLGYDFNTEVRKIITNYAYNKDVTVDPVIQDMINEMKMDDGVKPTEQITYIPNAELVDVELPSSDVMLFFEELNFEKSRTLDLVVLCVVILLFFGFVGFIIALFFESSRNLILHHKFSIQVIGLILFLGLSLLLRKLGITQNLGFVFSIGIFLGIVLTLGLYRKRKKRGLEETP